MEFRFSPLEEDLRRAVSDFVQREMSEREFDLLDHIPIDLIKKMGDLGFFSMKVPDEYGGQSGSWVEVGLLAEELAKGDPSVAHLIMLSYGINLLLVAYAEREIIEEILPNLASGRKIGCIALTESEAGSDVAAIKTHAIKDGDYYRINGRKRPVSFGMQADYTILFAKTDTQAGTQEITAFLVSLDTPGIKKEPFNTMGLKCSAPASFIFDDVLIPISFRLGSEGEGLKINSDLGLFSGVSRILSGLICLGTAQSALRQAVVYAKKRNAFGRPIAQFEGISGKIAEDVTLLEAGRWLCYRGLSLRDRELSYDNEAAMCGWWCPTIAFQTIENALLIHGHAGYSVDHPFQKMLRDITAFEILVGTAGVLKRIIARNVIGNAAIPAELDGVIA